MSDKDDLPFEDGVVESVQVNTAPPALWVKLVGGSNYVTPTGAPESHVFGLAAAFSAAFVSKKPVRVNYVTDEATGQRCFNWVRLPQL